MQSAVMLTGGGDDKDLSKRRALQTYKYWTYIWPNNFVGNRHSEEITYLK